MSNVIRVVKYIGIIYYASESIKNEHKTRYQYFISRKLILMSPLNFKFPGHDANEESVKFQFLI